MKTNGDKRWLPFALRLLGRSSWPAPLWNPFPQTKATSLPPKAAQLVILCTNHPPWSRYMVIVFGTWFGELRNHLLSISKSQIFEHNYSFMNPSETVVSSLTYSHCKTSWLQTAPKGCSEPWLPNDSLFQRHNCTVFWKYCKVNPITRFFRGGGEGFNSFQDHRSWSFCHTTKLLPSPKGGLKVSTVLIRGMVISLHNVISKRT